MVGIVARNRPRDLGYPFGKSLSPLVTAIITTRARPQPAHEALASVCAETYRDVECLVVDDGGTFALPEASPELTIRVLRSGRSGVARARNAGLAAARC